MRIHKAGTWPILIILLMVLFILVIINIFFPVQTIVHYILYIIGVVFILLVIRFFRYPERDVIKDDQKIYSAADGTIVAIEEVEETEYFNDKRIQISVFMPLLNVHVNWYPVGGIVKYIRHYPGVHHPAYVPKASMENEMTSIIVEDYNKRLIMIRQIAGIMARRIVCNAKVNTGVSQGDELGIIKFGSRVDLFLPVNVDIKIKMHQKVRAGETVIAEF